MRVCTIESHELGLGTVVACVAMLGATIRVRMRRSARVALKDALVHQHEALPTAAGPRSSIVETPSGEQPVLASSSRHTGKVAATALAGWRRRAVELVAWFAHNPSVAAHAVCNSPRPSCCRHRRRTAHAFDKRFETQHVPRGRPCCAPLRRGADCVVRRRIVQNTQHS